MGWHEKRLILWTMQMQQNATSTALVFSCRLPQISIKLYALVWNQVLVITFAKNCFFSVKSVISSYPAQHLYTFACGIKTCLFGDLGVTCLFGYLGVRAGATFSTCSRKVRILERNPQKPLLLFRSIWPCCQIWTLLCKGLQHWQL